MRKDGKTRGGPSTGGEVKGVCFGVASRPVRIVADGKSDGAGFLFSSVLLSFQ